MKRILTYYVTLGLFFSLAPALAQEKCAASDKNCLMRELETTAATIEEEKWRDQTYRELAKSYTYEGQPDKAISLIDKIINPDTKAMTIRGIGMAAADSKWDEAKYSKLFTDLTAAAEKIDHPPSYAIAYTYIAMAQAFAGDDAGAMATAKGMENDALRHKAFGETAEIQAERGDYAAAMQSITAIDDRAFRNKAYRIVSKIFAKRGEAQKAYDTAVQIDNPYTKSEALQTILNIGNPEEE